MSHKFTLELNPADVEQLVDKLSLDDKIKLVRKLENETWARIWSTSRSGQQMEERVAGAGVEFV